MNKKFAIALTIACLTLGSGSIYAATNLKAVPMERVIYLDGSKVECTGYTIEGNNYFKLRDLATVLNGTGSTFNVGFNNETGMIEIITGEVYTGKQELAPITQVVETAYETNNPILVDGVKKQLKTYTINNSTYFKLRDLADIVGCEIEINYSTGAIELTSQSTYMKKIDTVSQKQSNRLQIHGSKNWTSDRWAENITDYLVEDNQGVKTILSLGDNIEIVTYDTNWKVLEKKELPLELPLFGGFYSGEKFNYIVYGCENSEEDDKKEIMRIVKYDKQFNRIEDVKITGGESFTVIPFDAGSLRMAEYGDTLVVHTSRERYLTEDGLNHQSQLTVILNTASMKVTNDLGRFQKNHVSHSFDQFVKVDGNEHVLVDLGDAYPRTVVLQKGNGSSYKAVDLFDIPGKIGANCTGVSIGGFEVTKDHYVVGMNTIDHSKAREYTSYEIIGPDKNQRDVILCRVPKNSLLNNQVKQIQLTDYRGTDYTASAPYLVKISDDKVLVLWEEYNMSNTQDVKVKYVYVDSQGEMCSEIETMKGARLSKCQPVITQEGVSWFVDQNSKRLVCTLPLA